MTETWRAVVGFEGAYEVSDRGRVRSLDRFVPSKTGALTVWREGTILKMRQRSKGNGDHLWTCLSRPGKRWQPWVHRLVLEAFIGSCPDGMECCHNDGDATNNHLENLRWDTKSANMRDKILHGTDPQANKTHCVRGHEFDAENTYYYKGGAKNGARGCRACGAWHARNARAAKRQEVMA